MPTLFSRLLDSGTHDDRGLYAVEVPEDWMQGRSVFGGLQVAIAMRAMRALVPDVPVRTVQATFFAPVDQGLVRAQANVVRSGKSATHVEARLLSGEASLASVTAVFGKARGSTVHVAPTQPTFEPNPEGPVELAYVPDIFPAFVQHFRATLLRGKPPFASDTMLDHVLDVGLVDEARANDEHVIALADFIPPIGLSHLGAPAPGSTLTWMLEMLVDRVPDVPLTGWRVDGRLLAARDGYTSQSVMLWSPQGEPIAVGHQSMMIFG